MEDQGSFEGAVPADDNQCINVVFAQVFRQFFRNTRFFQFREPSCPQDGSAQFIPALYITDFQFPVIVVPDAQKSPSVTVYGMPFF